MSKCLFGLWKAGSLPLPHTSRFWPVFDEASVQAYLAAEAGDPVMTRPLDRAAAEECLARKRAYVRQLQQLSPADYACLQEYIRLEEEHIIMLDLILSAADGKPVAQQNDRLFGAVQDLRLPEATAYLKWHIERLEAACPAVEQARARLLTEWQDVPADDGLQKLFTALDGYRLQLRPYVAERFGFVDGLLAEHGGEGYSSPAVVKILNVSLENVFGADKAGWQAALREGVPNVFIDYDMQAIVVPAGRSFTREHVAKLIIHEIGVHVVRSVHGAQSAEKLAGFGLPGYGPAEEALGVLMQLAPLEKTDYMQSLVGPAVISLAGRCTSFRQAHEMATAILLCLQNPAKDAGVQALRRQAFSRTLRAYRLGNGMLVDRSTTKYWRGLLLLDEYFRAHPITRRSLEQFFVGKYEAGNDTQYRLITEHR